MALPALAGVGWLAGLVANAFAALLVFFGKFFTARLAAVAAMIVAALALTAAFYVAIAGVIGLISPIAPPFFSDALGMFLPSNAKACISAIFSAFVLRWLYDWQVKILSWKNPGAGF